MRGPDGPSRDRQLRRSYSNPSCTLSGGTRAASEGSLRQPRRLKRASEWHSGGGRNRTDGECVAAFPELCPNSRKSTPFRPDKLGSVRRRRILSWAVAAAAVCACRASDKPQTSTTPAAPSSVVRLSSEATRAGGVETAVAGEMKLGLFLPLTGTLAEKPWTPEEQTALSDAESADAKLRLAQASFDRLSRLSADGIASRQDLDAARADRDQARATAAQADAKRANLGLSEVSSVGGEAKIWGLANLTEADFARVSPGAKVEITTEAFPNRGFNGRVVAISRSADPQTRNFTVRIAIEDPSGSLRPQMLATFAISTPAPAGLAIPRSALLLEGDGSYVYIAQGDTFRRQRVQTGESTSEYVTVKDGVSPGQRVVTRGAQILESERLKSRLRPSEQD